jgi:peroxiredoxin
MKRISLMSMLFAAMLGSAALPAWAALSAGDAAPSFEAPASLAGKSFDFSLQNLLAKGPVVVYFFPSAFTSGCNIQAHEFSENYDKFTAAHASIVGVSLDSIDRLNSFSADPKFCAGKFPVASDADGKIAKSYGLTIKNVPGLKDTRGIEVEHGLAERTTFIVTKNGKIASVIGGLAPDKNVEQALHFVQHMNDK